MRRKLVPREFAELRLTIVPGGRALRRVDGEGRAMRIGHDRKPSHGWDVRRRDEHARAQINGLLNRPIHVRRRDVCQPMRRTLRVGWKLHHPAERDAVARPHRVRRRPWKRSRSPTRHPRVETRRSFRVAGQQFEPDKSSPGRVLRHSTPPFGFLLSIHGDTCTRDWDELRGTKVGTDEATDLD